MQTPYENGRDNALEALDQAAGLMEREPDYYCTLGDVLASYRENIEVDPEHADEALRGFYEALQEAGVNYERT